MTIENKERRVTTMAHFQASTASMRLTGEVELSATGLRSSSRKPIPARMGNNSFRLGGEQRNSSPTRPPAHTRVGATTPEVAGSHHQVAGCQQCWLEESHRAQLPGSISILECRHLFRIYVVELPSCHFPKNCRSFFDTVLRPPKLTGELRASYTGSLPSPCARPCPTPREQFDNAVGKPHSISNAEIVED